MDQLLQAHPSSLLAAASSLHSEHHFEELPCTVQVADVDVATVHLVSEQLTTINGLVVGADPNRYFPSMVASVS